MNVYNEKMLTKRIKKNEGVTVKLPEDTGSYQLSFGISEILPGNKTVCHSHEKEEELIYLIEGKGICIIDSTKYEVSSGDILLIKKGQDHQFLNKGQKVVKMLFAVSPPLKLE